MIKLFDGIVQKSYYFIHQYWDPDPGSDACLIPGSELSFFLIPDLGSRIPDPQPIFMRSCQLGINFWGKNFFYLSVDKIFLTL
jgi:hypothetical protein